MLFLQSCLYLSMHTHTKESYQQALQTHSFILTQLIHYHLIPGNSKQPGHGPHLHMLLVIRGYTFVFMHLFVSVTEQVSWFTAKGVLTVWFPPSPALTSCEPASLKSYFGTAGR